jgi:hypothetical protein
VGSATTANKMIKSMQLVYKDANSRVSFVVVHFISSLGSLSDIIDNKEYPQLMNALDNCIVPTNENNG